MFTLIELTRYQAPMKHIKKTESGFTLVEMIIVLVLIAVLSAVAIPSYIDYADSARRSEGVAAVLAVLMGAKTYYQNQDPTSFNGATLAALDVDVGDAQAHWTILIPSTSSTSIVINAAGNTGAFIGLEAELTYTIGAGSNTTVIRDAIGGGGNIIFD